MPESKVFEIIAHKQLRQWMRAPSLTQAVQLDQQTLLSATCANARWIEPLQRLEYALHLLRLAAQRICGVIHNILREKAMMVEAAYEVFSDGILFGGDSQAQRLEQRLARGKR